MDYREARGVIMRFLASRDNEWMSERDFLRNCNYVKRLSKRDRKLLFVRLENDDRLESDIVSGKRGPPRIVFRLRDDLA